LGEEGWEGQLIRHLLLLCVYASLLVLFVPGIGWTTTAASVETRIGAFDFADGVRVEVKPSLALELRRGYGLAHGHLASGFLPVPRGTPKLLPAPRQIEAAWGASTYRHGGLMGGMEHIMYRHSAHSGFSNVSRFAESTTARQVMGYVDEALRYGNVTKTGPTAYTVEHTLGRTIGTSVAGDATSAIRVYVRDGVIQSAFPF
jgi:hypothetical protein